MIFIATVSGTPARLRLRTAVRRKSCGNPARTAGRLTGRRPAFQKLFIAPFATTEHERREGPAFASASCGPRAVHRGHQFIDLAVLNIRPPSFFVCPDQENHARVAIHLVALERQSSSAIRQPV